MKNVVEPLKKFHKAKAVELRKKGFSYSEIRERLEIPKSTLSLWLKKVVLTDEQQKKLQARRSDTAKANSEKRILRTSKLIEEIKNSSAKDIKKISRREFWLMGIILYWKERLSSGNVSDLKNGVRLTSSDPVLINFFIKWLIEIGGIKKEEIQFDMFMKKDDSLSPESVRRAVLHWSIETGFPKEDFLHHIYFQNVNYINKNVISKKDIRSKGRVSDAQLADSGKSDGVHISKTDASVKDGSGDNGNDYKKVKFGLLRVRVRASSMLARQIAGWMEGIQKSI